MLFFFVCFFFVCGGGGGVGMVNLLPLCTSDMTIKYIVILLYKYRKFGGMAARVYYIPAIFKTR